LPQKVNLRRDGDLIEIISAIVDDPVTPTGWREVRGQIKLRGCMTEATILEGCTQIHSKRNAAATPIKLRDFPSELFVLPDTTDVKVAAGERLHLLPLRTTLRQTVGNDTKTESTFGTLIVILEGMILEHVAGEAELYRRTGQFVVDDLDHVGFLGLRAFPRFEGSTTYQVVVEKPRTVITLV
jgi:hypothetical protein